LGANRTLSSELEFSGQYRFKATIGYTPTLPLIGPLTNNKRYARVEPPEAMG
jgi:hypothetical protein